MLLTDILLQLCLLTLCIVWWLRSYKYRNPIRWIASFGALGFSCLSMMNGRWQAMPVVLIATLIILILAVEHMRQKKPRSGLPVFSGPVLFIVAALSVSLLYLFPIFSLPTPSGEHKIGTRYFEVSNKQDASEPKASTALADRIFVRVWYPANVSGSEKQRKYATNEEAELVYPSLSRAIGLPAFFFKHLKNVRTHSYIDAPTNGSEATSPVVFFSHGYASILTQNTVLMEHLASHGYTVFSVAHPYNGAVAVSPDGDIIGPSDDWYAAWDKLAVEPLSEATINRTAGIRYEDRFQGLLGEMERAATGVDIAAAQSAGQWLADRLSVTSSLADGDAPNLAADIIRQADFSRIAHMGMSFGGSTSAEVCYLSDNCKAAINLDGADYHYGGIDKDIPVPLLMLHSDWVDAVRLNGETEDADLNYAVNDFSYEQFATAGEREDIYRFRIDGAKHLGLSDSALMFRGPIKNLLVGSLDGNTLITLTNDIVLGFLDAHLQGQSRTLPQQLLDKHSGVLVPHSADGVRAWWLSLSDIEREQLQVQLDQGRDALPTLQHP